MSLGGGVDAVIAARRRQARRAAVRQRVQTLRTEIRALRADLKRLESRARLLAEARGTDGGLGG